MYQAPQQLPVPYDRWDQSTYNAQLPQGNDVFPNIKIPPGIDPNIASQVVSEFRNIIQSRVTRHNTTPLHIFAYNLFAQNRFNSQEFAQWCQIVVDFTDFLMRAQNNPPQVAIPKAVERIYTSALAMIAAQYPAIVQMLENVYHQELIKAATLYQDIARDIQAFQSQQFQHGGGYQPPPVHGFHRTPQPQYGGYQPPPQPQFNYGTMAPSAYQAAPAPQNYHSPAPMTQPSHSGAGRYADEPVVAAPTETVNTWSTTAPQPSTQPLEVETIRPGSDPTPVRETHLPVPRTLDEVVIDPNYYLPAGSSVDPAKPYDVIHNPGDVEIRPAQKSGWTRTRSDVQPYAELYDPNLFVKFHVRWPDGVVQEKIVELTADMEYLKHELDEQLRQKHYKPEGKVVYNEKNLIDLDTATEPTPEVEDVTMDQHLSIDALNPIIVPGVFGASTGIENEYAVRTYVRKHASVPEDVEVLPAHEYQSARLYSLDISKECAEQLASIGEECSTVTEIADMLNRMKRDDILPLRYFRFINERLTEGINRVLADNLSMGHITIDSFAEDIGELLQVLARREGPEIVTVVNSKTPIFISRWLSYVAVVEDEKGEEVEQPSLVDQFISLQTGWNYGDLLGLDLESGPALINKSTHPRLHSIIYRMLARHRDSDTLTGRSVRVITADGTYLEVVRGWLVRGSILLKKL